MGVTSAAALLKPNPQPKFTSAKVTVVGWGIVTLIT